MAVSRCYDSTLVSAGIVGMSYAELLCESSFSFQRGASQPDELVKCARAAGYAALAITDECSLAGIVRAHEAAKQAGLKLIVGSQFTLPDKTRLALLAPTQAAYTQLCELITRARRAARKGKYVITRSDFETTVPDCIGIWVTPDLADERIGQWFASLPLVARYIACVHYFAHNSDERIARAIELSKTLELDAVAVGDVHYHVRVRDGRYTMCSLQFG